MNNMGRHRIGLGMLVLTLASAGLALGQTTTAPAPGTLPTIAPATTAATAPLAPAKKPTIDELLSDRKPVAFDFSVAPMKDVMDFIAASYDLDIVNKYPFTDRVTIQFAALNARQAIDVIPSE